jgi:hypothetical protein
MALLSAVCDYPVVRVGCFFFVGLIVFAILHAILGPNGPGSLFAGMGAILTILFVHAYFAENGRKERASWQRIADEFGLNLASNFGQGDRSIVPLIEGQTRGRQVFVCYEPDVEMGGKTVLYIDGDVACSGSDSEVRDVLRRVFGTGSSSAQS